eukprot:1074287-Amorphochlora_amoeboformis.AAC.1
MVSRREGTDKHTMYKEFGAPRSLQAHVNKIGNRGVRGRAASTQIMVVEYVVLNKKRAKYQADEKSALK